jgi:glycosyltransferase involved in cell wall biosynthesis
MKAGEGRDHAVVVRLITRLNIGGPAQQALILTRELAATHPTVLGAGTPTAVEGEMSDPAVEVHRLPLVRPVRPATDVAAVAAVRHLLAEQRPRLVHTHLAKAGTVGRAAALTLGRPRPRLMHTFHGHVLEGYFGPATQRAFLGAERALAARTDVLIAVSPQVRDELLALGIGAPSQYRVVPLGLDLSRFADAPPTAGALRRRLGLGPDVPLVVAAGRLVPIKDLGTMLAAVAQLPGVHLALLGDGECRAELEARAAELGLAGRAHFLGWYDDLPGALADADVVALTSRNEGTPVAVIEALASATPVVATDVGGVAFVVDDGVTGLLAPKGDASAVAERLGRLLGDRDLAAKLAEAGRRDVLERFGYRRLVADISALYDELLGS